MATVVKAKDVAPGSLKAIQVGDKAVAVANVDGTLYAVDDLCPHRGCSLSGGSLAGTIITCPCHGSKFDISNGAVIHGPATTGLATFDVQKAGDDPTTEAAPSSSEAFSSNSSVLSQVPLFSDMDPTSLMSLEAFSFRRAFAPGELIVQEGRTGNGLFVVLSGQVEVIKGLGTGREEPLAVLGPGEPFGEMALLGEWKRSASVRASQEVECLGLDRWVFLSYLNREPQFAIKMLQMLAQRLAEAGEKLAE